jgi:hypothetical protein
LLFEKHMNEKEEACCLDLEEKQKPTDREAQELIRKLCKTKCIDEFRNMPPDKHDNNIALLKANGLSIRQISRLTGISYGIA